MKSNFPRTIHFLGDSDAAFKITVFVGVFNGAQYLKRLENQLITQDFQRFNLLVVDNNSSDDSLSKLLGWKETFGHRLTLVTNLINLGAHGSMRNNIDLISTKWFSQIHQDDFYLNNHLQVLSEGIETSTDEIVSVSSLMGSLSADGKKIGAPPRAATFIRNFDQPSALLQNLRTHCVPDPATAFRLDAYKNTLSHWHSTAFPDTEQILKLCAHGIFKFIPKETMLYRENPNSQSHSIRQSESELGTYIALTRFFHSAEFETIFNLVPNSERYEYLNGIFLAIEYRLRNRMLFQLLQISILEVILDLTDYSESRILSYASRIFALLGYKFPEKLLFNLSQNFGNEPISALPNNSTHELSAVLGSTSTQSLESKEMFWKKTYREFGFLIPLKLRNHLWKISSRMRSSQMRNSQFDFDWRDQQGRKKNT